MIGGRYRISRKIAEGGMGEVFEAEHNLSKKTIALKLLFPHIGKDEAARQRFLREVSAPAQIGHEGIVEVYDAGFDPEDGSLFVAMEFLRGEPLRDRLAKGGVPIGQLLDWFEEILDPLAAAHEKGIVHRDLKPENIMFSNKRDGTEVLKILDFGIARDLDTSKDNVTHTGIAMGTPHYMAPEQAMSAKGVTAAADVWALGVMLYEALLGRTPFDGETASAIVVHACTQPHASLSMIAPHVPPALAHFVDRCLAKDPNGRPPNARQMLNELRQVRSQIGLQTTGRPISPHPAATGPMAGAPHSALVGVAGTAVLPAAQQGGYGTPPPQQFGTGQGSFGQGGFGQAPSGFGQAPSGFGQAPSGFGTPPGQPGGYPTPPPGSFGGPTPQPGLTPLPAGGFGTSPGGSFGTGVSAPGGFAPSYPQPTPKKGGIALPLIAAVLIGGIFIIGAGITISVLVFANDDGGGSDQPVGSIGSVRVQTDVSAGELFVDGSTHGAIVPGQTFRLHHGQHHLEIHEAGMTVASADVNITANQESSVTMNRTTPVPPPDNGNTGNGGLTNDYGTGTTMVPGNVRTMTGQLRPGDQQLQSGEYYDTYDFQWTAGTVVRLELDATDFDTYLILKAPSGVQLDNDDRFSGNLNAGIQTTLNETGTWQVLCTSFSAGQTGDYTLTVHAP
ncbi:MAG: protein kinase [Sandaracinaceae bacterium]